ncbi:hypothetical protein [Neobacillus niacini]|uniref:hypothetical protein n=1 Tax=Neobacillus niacini TaxID=86668 RepID=UPI00203DB032|nr:hypothetical protein [Neobacillus niacini]MCM3693944.1 hypothetical protein [Neobacillus niacini]
MSFPNIPNITPLISVTTEQTVPLLLASIALEELALAHIMNAEAEKLQFVLGTLDDTGVTFSPAEVSLGDLLDVNTSVQRTLRDVIKKEMLLEFKFENILDLIGTLPPPEPVLLDEQTFVFTGDTEEIDVPAGATFARIQAVGARGGGTGLGSGGFGASLQGDFPVTPGETLTVLVGQVGGNASDAGGSGGGGGSFVWRGALLNATTLLVAAAGGGGGTDGLSGGNASLSGGNTGLGGSSGTAGVRPAGGGGGAGITGSGGNGGNGTNATGGIGGVAINLTGAGGGGGTGTPNPANNGAAGGFGGGGGGGGGASNATLTFNGGGGGGGGYNGGNGGNGSNVSLPATTATGGQGGLSLNNGTNQVSMQSNTNNGSVTISFFGF